MISICRRAGSAKSAALVVALATLLAVGSMSEPQGHSRAQAPRDVPLTRLPPDDATTDRIAQAYGRLPLSFERNLGQTDSRAEFLARGKGYTLFLNKGGEAVLSLRASRPLTHGNSASGAVLKLRLVGAARDTPGRGQSELPGKVNYLVGATRSAWRSGIPTYSKVQYHDLYPGIDAMFYGNQRELEYDFVVKPGADPNRIVLEFEGADDVAINRHGELVATLGERSVVQRKPSIYQEAGGVRREIHGKYVLVGRTRAAFQVETYDHAQTLVIDPVLVYSTYLDGTLTGAGSDEQAQAIALDADGNVYVTGWTNAVDFPTTAGALDTSSYGYYAFTDAFVTKVDSTGGALVYSTYLGGGGSDVANGIAVDSAGSAYVTGSTNFEFPTTAEAFAPDWLGGGDAFVSKLDPSGAALVYSTHLGGNASDSGADIAVDAAGSAYVTGSTNSADFPTTPGAFDTSWNGTTSVFVTKLDPSGRSLAYSTYLSGGYATGYGIAVDAVGSAYLIGSTLSADFPTTPGAFDTSLNGGGDAFVTKLDSTGATLVYSTYLGGSNFESPRDIAVDAAGSAYLTGTTGSFNFPTTAGAFDTSLSGGNDAFVTKLDSNGAALVYSTYLGGGGAEDSPNIAVDTAGSAYVTGMTTSADFPITAGAVDSSGNGGYEVFVTKLDPSGAALGYSTYLGGSGDEFARGIVVDPAGSAYVTGYTTSADFPTTVGAFDVSWSARSDAFVTKLNPSGAALVYATYLGGTLHGAAPAATGVDISVDVDGSAYLIGSTSSIDFPTTGGAFDTSSNGNSDVFVTKLDPNGEIIAYSTYLGGSNNDAAAGIAVDPAGSVYLTGSTLSIDFPTTGGAFDTSSNGGHDVFVTKLDASGGTIAYSTYLGGASTDNAAGIAVDPAGRAYIIGTTWSITQQAVNFPTTAGAFDTTSNGGFTDVFVTKLEPNGAALGYSTYLGGNETDSGRGIAVDSVGSAYVIGDTWSSDFPTTAGAFDTSSSPFAGNVFVTRLEPSGAALGYSTYLGGDTAGYNYGAGIAVDPPGSAYVVGYTSTFDFPTTAGAFDTSLNGGFDVFVTKLDPSGALTYSTYIGGSSDDVATSIAVDLAGSAYLTGYTSSATFPTSADAFDTSWNDSQDVFVTRLDPSGAALEYSTYLGGSEWRDAGLGIAVDDREGVYVIGSTDSPDFPTTTGAFDSTANGGQDVFVVKLSSRDP